MRSLRRNSQASGDEPPPISLLVEWIAAMGREQGVPFPAIPQPFGVQVYPDGRVGVIHLPSGKVDSANFAQTGFWEVRAES